MAFTKEELAQHKQLMDDYMAKRRPREDIRDKLDLGYRIKGQSIEIFEIRPFWNDPRRTIEESVAKTRYVRTQNVWKVFWMRQDLKWHAYPLESEVPSLLAFLKLVDKDEMACFWG